MLSTLKRMASGCANGRLLHDVSWDRTTVQKVPFHGGITLQYEVFDRVRAKREGVRPQIRLISHAV
jgi:hypothetical protein